MKRKHEKYSVAVYEFLNDDGDKTLIIYKEFHYKRDGLDFISPFLNTDHFYIEFYCGNNCEVFE